MIFLISYWFPPSKGQRLRNSIKTSWQFIAVPRRHCSNLIARASRCLSTYCRSSKWQIHLFFEPWMNLLLKVIPALFPGSSTFRQTTGGVELQAVHNRDSARTTICCKDQRCLYKALPHLSQQWATHHDLIRFCIVGFVCLLLGNRLGNTARLKVIPRVIVGTQASAPKSAH